VAGTFLAPAFFWAFFVPDLAAARFALLGMGVGATAPFH
jgi:hypothetical protein